ncbi:hypothetical protein WOSG25_110790 [Weissella oryzae SG25]|uniref:Uncharacterized protein n=1 Tax=Weissella oryzae (strain DSM 25784 / JCM 18191 / LMG 30913 / SG25) TaxID=1329250 RepID=A0A069D2E6_WEIOS|nr:hypothetical protein [Weissella oryzae]GAK31601.1 hypothetical protein WOSG25_110790 [Weissella oryzae SG25]
MRYISKNDSNSKTFWGKLKQWRSDKRYDFFDNYRTSLTLIFLILIMIPVGLALSTLLSSHSSNQPGARFNQAQSFGTFGKTATLTKASIDSSQNKILLYFDFSNGNNFANDPMNWNNIKFDFKGDKWLSSNPKTLASFIPTSTNTGVIEVEHVNSGFQDIQVVLKDKQIDPTKVSIASTSSSSQNTITDSDDLSAKFIINRDTPKNAILAKNVTQTDLIIQETNAQIKNLRTLVAKNNDSIKQIAKSNAQLQSDKSILESQKASVTNDTDSQSIDSQINAKQQLINSGIEQRAKIKAEISDQNLKLKKLNSQLNDAKAGKNSVGKVIKF